MTNPTATPRRLRSPANVVLTVLAESLAVYRVLAVEAPTEHGPHELLVGKRFTRRALQQFADGLDCAKVAAYAVPEYPAKEPNR